MSDFPLPEDELSITEVDINIANESTPSITTPITTNNISNVPTETPTNNKDML
jgi:hypothetical protein